MANWYSEVLPPWARLAVTSLVVIASSYVLGQLLKAMVGRYLMAFAQRTVQTWDDVVAAELSKRIALTRGWPSSCSITAVSGPSRILSPGSSRGGSGRSSVRVL